MKGMKIIFKRELTSYFVTPLAYVFIVIFLMLTGVFTFYMGHFFESRQADLTPFFIFHPWLYLFLIPAISMRLWAEERKFGTLELLLTLPISLKEAVLGKFLAAWVISGIALLLTFPMWLSVNYLGNPDNGVILAGYIGSWLMAGGFLAIGSCMSAMTQNQVVAFIITVVVCFLFVVAGYPLVLDAVRAWLPQMLVDAIAALSFMTHFDDFSRGILDVRDLLYFIIMILSWLIATAIAIDMKKAN
ncbi:MAG: ABC transporter permease subunit [Endozoicomonas sp. (ex Botrylloides leachii)]|nr:ABC transporter permease subunit [Endozoicomonas sp. (ex Botrylloides leachii)]